MPLRTLAVDFNFFIASCEQQERPELRGQPVGIVPVMADTSCVIAASYPAKARGVKSGTGVAEARQVCLGIPLVEADLGAEVYPQRFNVAPTQGMPVVIFPAGQPQAITMRWGIVPFYAL